MMKKFGSSAFFNVISGSDENGKYILLTIIKWAFKVICMISTFILIIRGIDRYLENDDVTKIQTPTYKDDGMDIFPAISLCFEQKFVIETCLEMSRKTLVYFNCICKTEK